MYLQGQAVLLKAPNYLAPLDSMLALHFCRGEAYSQTYRIPAKDLSLVLNSESGSSSIPNLPQVRDLTASVIWRPLSILHLMLPRKCVPLQHLCLQLTRT